MCCAGCAAVAEAIEKAGLSSYYRHRTANPETRQDVVPIELRELEVYDHEEIQKSFVETRDGSRRKASLVLEGIQCAACVWLNERHLKSLPGILDVSINYSTQQASVEWDNDVIRLSGILASIRNIGYEAHPYDPNRRQLLLERQRKLLLKQFGVAAAIGMQVMILTVALYAGEWYGMEPEFEEFFRRFSLLLTIPVLFYSGRGFFRNALLDLKLGRVSMDVPVSLGIGLAFAASTLHVMSGEGAIYFESVCMFVLFLLGARYFELMSRMRAMVAAESIGYIRPSTARRLTNGRQNGETEILPALELEPDDLVMILPGDTIPVDGVVESGRSGIDESLLTGESAPVVRGAGDAVIGGSVNTESPLVVRVTRTGGNTVLAEIHRLLEQAFAEKPAIEHLANRVAAFFVVGVLTITAGVALFWFLRGSESWLAIAISVLVVSCPCALSMAVPTALSSSIARLIQQKILVTSERALETLPKATLFVFDKTGTLTVGRPRVTGIEVFGESDDHCLAIASALESASEHPVGRAIRDACREPKAMDVSELVNQPGMGVSGLVAGTRYWLGNRKLIETVSSAAVPPPDTNSNATEVFLVTGNALLCRFTIRDQLRADSAKTMESMRQRGMRTVLLSGDNRQVAEGVAEELGMDEVFADCSPEEKLHHVKLWQARGEVVAMIGDGVNDAPVLAGADISISVGGASTVAVKSADIVLLSQDTHSVVTALDMSVKTLRVMKQNLLWALGYNLFAIPAAAAGLVAPWLAALGMSLSSLIVIANASRLRGAARGTHPARFAARNQTEPSRSLSETPSEF